MNLVFAGISHHRASVALRERVALDADGAARLSRELAIHGAEAVCLSTCNRTEVYVVHPDPATGAAHAERPFVNAGVAAVLERLHGEAAADHLFRVASGLDSMVPGEGEILGQVRAAYEAGAAGSVLHRLFRQALHVGKKVRSQTSIGESPASVSAAAAALVRRMFGELHGTRIVLVGAGKASELAARNLLSAGGKIDVVVNRTLDHGRRLARGLGARPLPLEQVSRELERADVVISSTSARGYVLRREEVEAALPARRGRPLLVVDLAVPRDVDPAIRELDGCYLYDVDDLEALVADSLVRRRRAAACAEAIIAAELDSFCAWHTSLAVTPAIASLRARAEEIRATELARLQGRLGRLSEPERRAVQALTTQIVNKLLHLPTVRMKEAAATAEGMLYADALRHLFDLERV
jgi:glutamyl-tRNA reductase